MGSPTLSTGICRSGVEKKKTVRLLDSEVRELRFFSKLIAKAYLGFL